MVDTHCHLAHKKYSQQIDQIIKDSKKVGVNKFITVGTSLESNIENQKVANKYDEVYYSAGVYPHEEMGYSLEEIEREFREQLKNMPNVVAIGECGIDITDRPGQRSIEDQIKLFEMQIIIAKQLKVPLIIHNRNGDKYVLELLRKHSDKSLIGVAHTFTSTWEVAKQFLDLGFYISFSGIITYPTGKDILETVKNVPSNKFLVETDAPYLSPQPVRNQINKPEYVTITAQKIAEVKNLPLGEIEKFSDENATKLFNLSKN